MKFTLKNKMTKKSSKYAFFIQKNGSSKKVLIFMNLVNAFLNSICFHEFISKVLWDGYFFDLFNTKFAIVHSVDRNYILTSTIIQCKKKEKIELRKQLIYCAKGRDYLLLWQRPLVHWIKSIFQLPFNEKPVYEIIHNDVRPLAEF